MTSRRGSILLTVFVLLVLAALLGGGALRTIAAHRAGVETHLRRAQTRALARSAVLALAEEFASLRDDLLAGNTPSVELDLETSAGLARILPGEAGRPATSEAARLDINTAPTEALAALPGLDDTAAAEIVARREQNALLDPAEVLDLAGPPPDPDAPPLADLLTTYAADPPTQAGIGGEDGAGRRRLNIAAEWNDELENAITDLWGEQATTLVRTVLSREGAPRTLGELAQLLIDVEIAEDVWPIIFDLFTTGEAPFRLGLVDINTAPEPVIAALPGIDEDAAVRIVETRERLDPADLRGITWPLTEGILEQTAFAQAVDSITTRSLQWRATIEVGFGPPGDVVDDGAAGSLLPEADEFGVAVSGEDAAEAPLRHAMRLEVVVDVGSTVPRIAMLRDVTALAYRPLLAPYLAADDSEVLLREAGPARSEDEADPDAASSEDDPLGDDSFGEDPLLDDPFAADAPEADPLETTPPAPDAGPPAPAAAPSADGRNGRWNTGGGTP